MRTHSFSFWKLTLTAWAIKSALFHKPCANLSKQRQTFSAVQHLDHDIYHDTCQSRAKSLKSRHPRHPRHPSILAWDVSKAGSFTVEVPQLNCNCMSLPSKLSIRGSAFGKLAEIYGQPESGGTIVSQWFALRIFACERTCLHDISWYSFEIFLPETICLLRQPAHKHMYLWQLFTFLKYYMRFLNNI